MLSLSRDVGETIVVGDEVTITVVSVSGSAIRLGINAPRDISVHREEIYDAIKNGTDNNDTD